MKRTSLPALAAVGLLALGLAACGHDAEQTTSAPATSSSPAPTSSSPTETASPSASPTGTTESATPTAQKTYDAPADAYYTGTATPPPGDDVAHVEPFTRNDQLMFTSQKGATGTVTFDRTAPADVAQVLQWAGKPAGEWMVVHVDNRQGTEPVNFADVAPTLLDAAGHRYETITASDLTANLYGDADSSDPHQDDYYKVYDQYSKADNEVVAGEVRDIHVYSPTALPQEFARGTVSVDATTTPLMIKR